MAYPFFSSFRRHLFLGFLLSFLRLLPLQRFDQLCVLVRRTVFFAVIDRVSETTDSVDMARAAAGPPVDIVIVRWPRLAGNVPEI